MTSANPQHQRSVNSAIVRVVGRGQAIEFTMDPKVSVEDIEHGLREYLLSVKGRFDGGRVTLNMGNRHMTPDQVDALRTILEKENKLVLAGLSVGADALRELLETAPPQPAEETAATEEAAAPAEGPRVVRRSKKKAPPPPLEVAAESPDTLLVKGTCRSGVMIHNAGNVVVLGDVNPGAEISATRDIVIYGRLAGLAHAGASGAEDAMILAHSIEATQVRIGPHIMMDVPSRRSGDAGGHTTIALVKGGAITLEPFVARSVWTQEE